MGDRSEWPQDLQDSQGLDEGDFDCAAGNRIHERGDNDYEIENVPSVSDVALLARESEAPGDDLDHGFKRERHCHEEINFL